jgi:hypothetical protein
MPAPRVVWPYAEAWRPRHCSISSPVLRPARKRRGAPRRTITHSARRSFTSRRAQPRGAAPNRSGHGHRGQAGQNRGAPRDGERPDRARCAGRSATPRRTAPFGGARGAELRPRGARPGDADAARQLSLGYFPLRRSQSVSLLLQRYCTG